MDASLSRRSLLRASLLAGLSAEALEGLQHAHEAAQSGDGMLQYLDPQAAAEIETLAAQIIPSDDGPVAKEAGVIYFIDRALATFDRDQREIYRTGLAAYRSALATGQTGLGASGFAITNPPPPFSREADLLARKNSFSTFGRRSTSGIRGSNGSPGSRTASVERG
jgi:Gluconate 2-dehydrogenase subunit 3